MRLTPVAILCALLALTYLIGVTIYSQRIEQDIYQRSNAAISQYQPEISIQVNGRDVSLHGTVDSILTRQQASDDVDAVWGVRASENLLSVQPDQYQFDAIFKDKKLTLRGAVDSGSSIAALETFIHSLPDGIETRQLLMPGAPPLENSIDKLDIGLRNLTALIEGELHVNNRQWHLRGLALDPQQRETIEAAIDARKLVLKPLDVIVDIDIHSLISEQCRSGLQRLTGGISISFDSNSTAIKPEYVVALRRYAKLPQQCHGRLLIEAHADPDGDEAYNLALSKRRAKAVKNYLIELGAKAKSIHSFAYGEGRSAASNENHVSKSINRRVDLNFIQSIDALPSTEHLSPTVSLQSVE